jgi:hypothetical protein
MTKNNQQVFVVCTTIKADGDLIADVVLITPSEPRARRLARKLRARSKIQGLDSSLLAVYDSAAYFARDVSSLACWAPNQSEIERIVNKRKRRTHA